MPNTKEFATEYSKEELELLDEIREAMRFQDSVEISLNYQEIWDRSVIQQLEIMDRIPDEIRLTHQLFLTFIRKIILIDHPDVFRRAEQ